MYLNSNGNVTINNINKMQYKIIQPMQYEIYHTQISLQRDFHTVVLNGSQRFLKVLSSSQWFCYRGRGDNSRAASVVSSCSQLLPVVVSGSQWFSACLQRLRVLLNSYQCFFGMDYHNYPVFLQCNITL